MADTGGNPNAEPLSWNPLTWLQNLDNLPGIKQLEGATGTGGTYVNKGAEGTAGNVVQSATGLTAPNIGMGTGKLPPGFGKWLVGMVALAGVLLLMSDSDKWQPVGTALAAVIAVSVAFKWGKPAMSEVDAVFGTTFISKKA